MLLLKIKQHSARAGSDIVNVSKQLWHQTNYKESAIDKMPCDNKETCHFWRQLRMWEKHLIDPHNTMYQNIVETRHGRTFNNLKSNSTGQAVLFAVVSGTLRQLFVWLKFCRKFNIVWYPLSHGIPLHPNPPKVCTSIQLIPSKCLSNFNYLLLIMYINNINLMQTLSYYLQSTFSY